MVPRDTATGPPKGPSYAERVRLWEQSRDGLRRLLPSPVASGDR